MKKIITTSCLFLLSAIALLAQPSQQWVSTYNGLASMEDNVVKMVQDASGNTYAVGYSNILGSGLDIVLLKWDANGAVLWNKTYNGIGNDEDTPTDISIDGLGNIYVTGYTYSAANYYDIVLMKYDGNGNQQWVKTYNGTYSADDKATALFIDITDNVFVTGYSYTSANREDIITLKYSSSGILLWETSYDGSDNYTDVANDIMSDANGNTYVTGYTSTTNYEDIVTIKYNSAGTQVWAKTYNGTASDDDHGNSITLGINGNIIVTGYAENTGTNNDMTTIQYSSNGTQQWVSFYGGSSNSYNDNSLGVVSDNNGNVYIVGYTDNSGANADITTIKYNSAGTQQWVKLRNGSYGGSDYGRAIAIDNNSNIYITGEEDNNTTNRDIIITAYDNTGTLLWNKTHNGTNNYNDNATNLIIDASNNVYALGKLDNIGSGADFFMVKYNNVGDSLLGATFDSKGNLDDASMAMTTDSLGNVYTTGYAYNGSNGQDITTIKYDKTGVMQWIKTLDGTANGSDKGVAIAVDKNGNVYVTGIVDNGYSTTKEDIITVKYDASGNQQWMDVINGSGNDNDWANAIVVDELGNVYITGWIYNATSYDDLITVKYNSSGVKQWDNEYNGIDGDYDGGNALVLDKNNNVIVTGYTYSFSNYFNVITLKYSNNGTQLWEKTFDGTANETDEGKVITVDKDNNAYIAGYAKGSNGEDMVLLKYDGNGSLAWSKTYNGSANVDDEATAIAIDNLGGNVFIAGYSTNNGTSQDITTIKYNLTTGVQEWSATYNGSASANDSPCSIAIDDNSNSFVAGLSNEGGGAAEDMIMLKYNANGTQQWQKSYNGVKSSNDKATDMKIDKLGAIYIAGASSASGYYQDMAVLKYCDFPQSIITASGPLNICEGTNLTLTAPSKGTYLWSNGAATQSIKLNSTGSYYLTVSYSNGCSKKSDTLQVTVKPSPSVVITAVGATTKCFGDSVSLSATAIGSSFTTFLWSNGKTTNAIKAKTTSNYYAVLTYTNSCSDTSNYIPVKIGAKPDSIQLCYVTVDSASSYNRVIWQKPIATNIKSFKIYRETTSGYTLIKTLPYSTFSLFIDSTSNPATTFYRYKIAVVDTCGEESSLSPFHSTIFLQANFGVGGVVNLNWTAYEGKNVGYYIIMRDNNGTGNYQKIDSLSGSNDRYTDVDAALFPDARYTVNVTWSATCGASFKTAAASINTTRSNIKTQSSIIASGINELSTFADYVNLFPNPSEGLFNIKYPVGYKNYQVSIYNLSGALVYFEKIADPANTGIKQVSLNHLPKGFYTLKIEAGDAKAFKKLAVE